MKFKVKHSSDDVREFMYHGRLNKNEHKIELITPSDYQINGDRCIRNNLHDPFCTVEDEWFRQRNVSHIIE